MRWTNQTAVQRPFTVHRIRYVTRLHVEEDTFTCTSNTNVEIFINRRIFRQVHRSRAAPAYQDQDQDPDNCEGGNITSALPRQQTWLPCVPRY